jgi:hypothetical protein
MKISQPITTNLELRETTAPARSGDILIDQTSSMPISAAGRTSFQFLYTTMTTMLHPCISQAG